MFKLLTEEGREKVMNEYATRRTIVMLLSLILVLVIGIIGLLPSYILSNIRQKEAVERVRILSSSNLGGKDGVELKAWLEETNHRLKALTPSLDKDRPSIFVNQVLENKPEGVSINGFSWLRVKDKITFSVNGVAKDRQKLVTFENGISSSGHFSNVTLPISDLAKDKDIAFQIKFSPI